jgi:protein involved in ribonucleotide reduction
MGSKFERQLHHQHLTSILICPSTFFGQNVLPQQAFNDLTQKANPKILGHHESGLQNFGRLYVGTAGCSSLCHRQ